MPGLRREAPLDRIGPSCDSDSAFPLSKSGRAVGLAIASNLHFVEAASGHCYFSSSDHEGITYVINRLPCFCLPVVDAAPTLVLADLYA